MSQNVAEVLESQHTSLYERLAQNNDLANVIMAFLGRIVILCTQKGKPIQGVKTTEVTETQNEFRFGITFTDLILTPPGLWQPKDDLMSYAAGRSAHLAYQLEKNPKISATFRNLVMAVERWCKRKGIEFKDFKIKKAFIYPKTNTCVIRAGVSDFKDRFR